jgi:hypothetical protein
LIVRVADWKEYFSFASTIFTVTAVGGGVGVAFGGRFLESRQASKERRGNQKGEDASF